jgi:hypothetical protein
VAGNPEGCRSDICFPFLKHSRPVQKVPFLRCRNPQIETHSIMSGGLRSGAVRRLCRSMRSPETLDRYRKQWQGTMPGELQRPAQGLRGRQACRG